MGGKSLEGQDDPKISEKDLEVIVTTTEDDNDATSGARKDDMPIALLQELGALLVQHCIVANLPLLLAEVVQRFPAILSQVLHLATSNW